MSAALAGKVALVTGAARGIGRATALKLAHGGCDIAANYYNSAEQAEALCNEVRALGRRAVAIQGSVGVPDSVDEIYAELTKHFELKVTTPDPAALRNDIEGILRRYHVKFELRSVGQKEIVYDSELPLHTRTDRIANAVLAVGKNGDTEVAWEEKKTKK